MTYSLNPTHDPALRSWVDSANRQDSDFPIQNLPIASFRRRGSSEAYRAGVAIGDCVLDLGALSVLAATEAVDPLLTGALQAAAQPRLNALMALGPASWSALRRALSQGLSSGAEAQTRWQPLLLAQADVEYALPAQIGDYTDFYTSVHHATQVGKLFRPDNPLLPNYKWVPIGYHGRSSSIGISGESFHRPRGQVMAPGAAAPVLQPSQRLDIELEMGVFIGPGNEKGAPLRMDEAEQHVFGLCLLNDWSARDLQAWEYQPLGPFLAKNFATTISPWVVTLEALAPYRLPFARPEGDPQPLPYLDSAANRLAGVLDIQLEVGLQTQAMREGGQGFAIISQSNYCHAYWTVAQMVTHHAINGCNLQPGDLLGTGTLSGPQPEQAGALIELTEGGKKPLQLPNGEQRTYLADGDAVRLRGWCEKPGAARLGFGECLATLLPARA